MSDFQDFLAPAKVNVFLHITGQRVDGYHTLQSAFQLLDFYDTVSLKPTSNHQIKRITQIDTIPETMKTCVYVPHKSCNRQQTANKA
mgnify:CR=1 FL=1